MNVGQETIDWLYHKQLQVDEEWSVRTPRGFRWWPHTHAQVVEVVGEEKGPDGMTGYWISIRTDLVRYTRSEEVPVTHVNMAMMPFAAMAGVVVDSANRTMALHSLAEVNAINEDWMKRFLSVAAMLQVDEAEVVGPVLASLPGVAEAVSGHPENGVRPRPDDLVAVGKELVIPVGRYPSRWSAEEFEEVVRDLMSGPPALLATAGETGFTVEFPFGADDSSLCRVKTDEPHPWWGNGLLVVQSFRVKAESEEAGARLALEMNRAELVERAFGYGFGSYVYRGGMLHFNAFFPNVLHYSGFLRVLYTSCARRAREVSKRLTGHDWTPGSFSPFRSSFGRFFGI